MRDLTFGRDLASRKNAFTRFYLAIVKILHAFRYYDARNKRYASLIWEFVGSSLGQGRVVVDLGCGPGGMTSLLRGVHQLIGVDLDRYYLLRFVDPAIPRIQARAECLPFKDGRVGVIVAVSLVEHVADQVGLFRELARALESGGRLVLQFPELRFPIEPHTKWPLLHLWKPALQARILAATGYADLNMSVSLAHVVRDAEAAGFRVDQTMLLWHFKLARIVRQPMGYFVLLRR